MYRMVRVIMFALLLATGATSQANASSSNEASRSVSAPELLLLGAASAYRPVHHRSYRHTHRRARPYGYRRFGYRSHRGYYGRRYRTYYYWDGYRYRPYRRYY